MSRPALSQSLIGKPHPHMGESKGGHPFASTGAPHHTPNPGAPSDFRYRERKDVQHTPESVGEAARSTPEGVPALPDDAQGGAAALPCLNINNSTEPQFYKVEHDSLLNDCAKEDDNGVKVIKHDSNGRTLVEIDGAQIWVGGLSPSEQKKAFALVENIKFLVELYGLERLGFLTLTFKDNVTDFKEAQRRFNSLATHVLRQHFKEYIVVVEPQMRGAVHYHMIVVCIADIRTGFDFQSFYVCQREYKDHGRSKRFYELKAAYTGSSSTYLKGLWRHLRRVMSKYHFGRAELLPIRTNAEGIAHYVGNYLKKGSMYRGEQFKGARMVRYSRGWRPFSQNFSWEEGGKKWRKLVGEIAAIARVDSMEALTAKLGKQWAYRIRCLLNSYPDATAEEIASVLSKASAG